MIKRHAVMAFSFGMNPATISVGDGNPPAAPVAMSGFYYEERGGMVTQLVSLLLAGAGAQEHANRTGDDTRIRSEGFDSDALGMAIHFRSASGIGFHFRADLFIGGPVLKVGELPLVLDFGLTAGIMGPFAAGIVVRAAFPVTRFAALEATTHLGWGNVNELTAGAVLNGGNRFFVRGRAVLGASGIGYNGMVGVRL